MTRQVPRTTIGAQLPMNAEIEVGAIVVLG